ncbi:MAG: S46 family peptidase [bacterium]
MKFLNVYVGAIALLAMGLIAARPDEGMWPISEIQKLNLQSKGLQIDPQDIYNPQGVSLIDAIVNVGGCTGSFVSPAGLILTNHHCAYGAARAASTTEHDYIQNGFLAQDQAKEIPAKGYTVRITDSYRDVSPDVLSALSDTMDLAERTRTIQKTAKEIVAQTEKENPGKRAEVSEMFIGKTYVLFIYTFIKDVRLVYVPPRGIGEFGGENDNWVWPRHTGDFSFMRAYVAPDGSPADYAANNVPYRPRKHLQVAPAGVDEHDFVFVLGYPGSTFRHRTSHYLAYEQDVRLPYIADLFDWQIHTMEEIGKNDRAVALKHLSRIKSLANVMKNYRGKLQGLHRLELVETKRAEEKALQEFIVADAARQSEYGNALPEIGKLYDDIRSQAEHDLILDHLRNSSILLRTALAVYEGTQELQKPDLERESAFMERNLAATKEGLTLGLQEFYEPTDKIFLREMLLRAARLPQTQRIPAVDHLLKGGNLEASTDKFLKEAFAKTKLNDKGSMLAALSQPPEQLAKSKDPLILFARELQPSYQALKQTRQRREGAMTKWQAQLIDVKRQFLGKDFIPDANRTLRLTFGKIRGYQPADAVAYAPITTFKGVLEKTTSGEPFDTPSKLLELYQAKDFGAFKSSKLNDVPVAILYDLDTTGGNSGSPVLNASGELVGVNFDRSFEATINDYGWSDRYSRSIAVDIRYVLWVTQKFAGADYLLEEMNAQGEVKND